ncbi:MAG TPA: hypothetical protein VG733_10580, partial [Chthoniobacteraceae bacterium]|nr:hypothetical protein [Chthoniobacteraceae bacterium]
MKEVPSFFRRRKKTLVAAIALAVCAAVACAYFFAQPHPSPKSTNPNVIQPVLAVDYLEKLN